MTRRRATVGIDAQFRAATIRRTTSAAAAGVGRNAPQRGVRLPIFSCGCRNRGGVPSPLPNCCPSRAADSGAAFCVPLFEIVKMDAARDECRTGRMLHGLGRGRALSRGAGPDTDRARRHDAHRGPFRCSFPVFVAGGRGRNARKPHETGRADGSAGGGISPALFVALFAGNGGFAARRRARAGTGRGAVGRGRRPEDERSSRDEARASGRPRKRLRGARRTLRVPCPPGASARPSRRTSPGSARGSCGTRGSGRCPVAARCARR